MRLRKIIPVGPAAILLGAAAVPAALSQAEPGVWEVTGVPGAKAPIRECVSDVLALAQFEHRTENCSRRVIREAGSSTVVEYNCAGGGFGRSEIGVVTPRALRIETQGISGGLPFHYVAQARRVGECASRQTASRH